MKEKVIMVAKVAGVAVLYAGIFIGCYKLGAKFVETQNKRNVDYLVQQLTNANAIKN